MNMSVVDIVRLGRRYMNLWPTKPELATYFEEYRAIQVSRLVYSFLPGMALFVFVIQLYLGSVSVLPQALVYALFIASIPLQALVILGVKADKFLPPALATWYKEGVAKINQQGGSIKLSLRRPRYIDLAQLLNISYSQSSHS